MTTLQAEVTKTAAFNGAAVDISTLAAPYQWNLVVDALSDGKTAIFGLQTTVDSTPFSSDTRTEAVFSIKGPITKDNPVGMPPKHEYDLHAFRAGTTLAKARVALLYLDGSASVSYSSTITP